MADLKKPVKKRQLKKPVSIRESVQKQQTPKPRRVRKHASKVFVPFKFIGKIIKKIARPFRFVLIPFKTRPSRFVGRIIAKILFIQFFKEAWIELRQVKWPTAGETYRLTIAVFMFSLIFGVIVAITDYGLDKVFKKVFID